MIQHQTNIVMLGIILSCHPWYYTSSWELANDDLKTTASSIKTRMMWHETTIGLKDCQLKDMFTIFSHRIYVFGWTQGEILNTLRYSVHVYKFQNILNKPHFKKIYMFNNSNGVKILIFLHLYLHWHLFIMGFDCVIWHEKKNLQPSRNGLLLVEKVSLHDKIAVYFMLRSRSSSSKNSCMQACTKIRIAPFNWGADIQST